MTPLDASRLLIAAAGSTFAKDSVDVLKRFAKLKPVRPKSASGTLEQLLAIRIAELPMEILPEDYVRQQLPSGRPFGSRRLAEAALQLFDPIGSACGDLPCFAVVRWLSFEGHSNVLLFGPDGGDDAKILMTRRQERGSSIRSSVTRTTGFFRSELFAGPH
jgi:hypothetical protein